MKITDITPIPITYGHRGMLLVKIETDEGITGWGEGGISGQESGMASIIETFRPRLVGEDPRRIDHLWQVMFRGGFFEAGTVMSGAISAVDIALWDVLGKSLGVPCWQLLGGRSRDRIECYIGATPASARERMDEGWRYLRMEARSGSDSPDELDPDAAVRLVIESMHEARAVAGPDARICIDFHTRLNPPAAAQACNGIAEMRPFFVEDPLRSVSPKAYVAFRQRTAVPLAVGEECSSKWEFQQLIEEDAIDYARIDVCNVGGLTEARKVAAMAETHFIDVIPHNPLGPLSAAACVHLAVAIPNFIVLEYGVGADLAPDIFDRRFSFTAPHYSIPEAPGLGVEVNEAALEKHPWMLWSAPLLHRPDGGLNNW
ncbi:MAG: mandelate racemase/muconate lactonizing enzyme family protein [Verrucomicrobia bacterium]|nr:mandelate racemase/muconate lactonizing enzyme family protein [Verrucomicrobiota bacterium]